MVCVVCAGEEAEAASVRIPRAQWPVSLASRPVKEPVSKEMNVTRGITPQLFLESAQYTGMCICTPPNSPEHTRSRAAFSGESEEV